MSGLLLTRDYLNRVTKNNYYADLHTYNAELFVRLANQLQQQLDKPKLASLIRAGSPVFEGSRRAAAVVQPIEDQNDLVINCLPTNPFPGRVS